jgi:predicted nucleic acid-binding protein
MTDRFTGMSALYLDSNVIIYFIEDRGALRKAASEIILEAQQRGVQLVTSELALAECLHGAYRQQNETLAELYVEFLAGDGMFQLVSLSPPILRTSAKLAALHSTKLLDAIHVASALEIRCQAFVTNDRGIRTPDDLEVIQLT